MKQNYFLMFFIILGVQLLICNYYYISPYITLSLLPCIILLLPTRIGTLPAMLIAFTRSGGRLQTFHLQHCLRK